MKENQKKSFDFAADIVKQLITLSTAIITLSVTFSKDIIGVNNDFPVTLLAISWGLFIFSLFCGILTLMALTGTLQPQKNDNDSDKAKREDESSKEQKAIITKQIIDEAASKGILLEDIGDSDFSVYKKNVRLFSGLQILFFIIGLISTAVFGYCLLSKQKVNDHEGQYRIIRKSQLNNDTVVYIDTLYLPKK